MLKRIALTGLAFFLSQPATAGNDERLVLLPAKTTALCLSEDSTGFDWRDKKWIHTRFKSGEKYIAKKIPIEMYETPEKRLANDLDFCNEAEATGRTTKGAFTGFVEVCYEIKDMGSKGGVWASRTCTEFWEDGVLEKISCNEHNPQFFFLPEGAYISYPWHSNIDQTADAKDSLSIEVGVCSTIN